MKLRGFGWISFLLLVQGSQAMGANSVLPFKKQEPPPPIQLPLEEMTEMHRMRVKQVLDKQTMTAKGPAEVFPCQPEHYYFFLDHPHKAVNAWRKIGAKCVSIQAQAEQRFSWSDESGSDLVWETVFRGPNQRIWYAEGKVKPNAVMPLVPIKAVLVLNHREGKNQKGGVVISHYADLVVQTDSKTASMVTKMLGSSISKVSEQGLGQLQLFFSGLNWYLDRHPEAAEALFREERKQ